MSFLDAFLNILAILGIILVGGAIIFFLGDLLLSVLDPKRKKSFSDNREENEPEQIKERVIIREVQPEKTERFVLDEKQNESRNKLVQEENNDMKSVDFAQAQKEKNTLGDIDFGGDADFNLEEETNSFMNEFKTEEPALPVLNNEPNDNDINEIFNDDKDFDFDDFDFDAFFDEQNKENQSKKETSPEKIVEESEFLSAIPSTEEPEFTAVAVSNSADKPETVKEEAQPVAVEPVVMEENTVAPVVETNNVVTETTNQVNNTTTITKEVVKEVYVGNPEIESQLRAEIDALKDELSEQRKLYEVLKVASEEKEAKLEKEKADLAVLYEEAEKEVEKEPKEKAPLLTIDEYRARLELLRERLRVNEKELKANKKEFIPLKRVRKNLDKDKEKLRRREALVAKQKVMLYGVNNIVEIDQEKAQKLAEDLDLLDGLKLSVRHCEEVMEANKDRYPILETTNRILTTTNKELKADIEECENAIKKLIIANGETDADGQALVMDAQILEPVKRKRGRPRKEVKEETITIKQEEKIVHSAIEKTAETVIAPVVSEEVIVEENITPEITTETETLDAQDKIIEEVLQNMGENKKEEHVFDFDADEPSFDDLFAIENEENNDDNK